MALIICPECGKQISDKASACPNCGYPINATQQGEDKGQKLANLYERARKSLEVDDLTHAAEYYKQILDENPSDWEAYFYSYLGEFSTFTNAQAASVAEKLGNTIPPAYDMAIQDCDKEEANKRIRIISQKASDRLAGIAATAESLLRQYEGGSMLSPAGKAHNNLYKNMRPTVVNTTALCIHAYMMLDAKVVSLLGSDKVDDEICKECLLYIRRAAHRIAIKEYKPTSLTVEHLIKSSVIRDFALKINEFDPSFVVPAEQPTSAPAMKEKLTVETDSCNKDIAESKPAKEKPVLSDEDKKKKKKIIYFTATLIGVYAILLPVAIRIHSPALILVAVPVASLVVGVLLRKNR